LTKEEQDAEAQNIEDAKIAADCLQATAVAVYEMLVVGCVKHRTATVQQYHEVASLLELVEVIEVKYPDVGIVSYLVEVGGHLIDESPRDKESAVELADDIRKQIAVAIAPQQLESDKALIAELVEVLKDAYEYIDRYGVVSGFAIDKQKTHQERFFEAYQSVKRKFKAAQGG